MATCIRRLKALLWSLSRQKGAILFKKDSRLKLKLNFAPIVNKYQDLTTIQSSSARFTLLQLDPYLL